MNEPSYAMRRRRNEPLPDAAVVMVRGDLLEADGLRETATRNHDRYGFWGVSVFAAAGEYAADELAATKLLRSELLVLFGVGDLIAAGLELWDTGQAPHYDIVHEDLGELVEHLLTCPHRVEGNPHYELEAPGGET